MLKPPSKEEVVRRAHCLGRHFLRAQIEHTLKGVPALRQGPAAMLWEAHERIVGERNAEFEAQGLVPYQSPEEKRLAAKALGTWDDQEILNGIWRLESVGIMLWALSIIDKMPPFDRTIDKKQCSILSEKVDVLDLKSRLRPQPEIAEARDVAELWHWRSRTTRVIEEGAKPPAGLSFDDIIKVAAENAFKAERIPRVKEEDFPAFKKAYKKLDDEEYIIASSIAYERHFALNWLCGYSDSWDETPTDT